MSVAIALKLFVLPALMFGLVLLVTSRLRGRWPVGVPAGVAVWAALAYGVGHLGMEGMPQWPALPGAVPRLPWVAVLTGGCVAVSMTRVFQPVWRRVALFFVLGAVNARWVLGARLDVLSTGEGMWQCGLYALIQAALVVPVLLYDKQRSTPVAAENRFAPAVILASLALGAVVLAFSDTVRMANHLGILAGIAGALAGWALVSRHTEDLVSVALVIVPIGLAVHVVGWLFAEMSTSALVLSLASLPVGILLLLRHSSTSVSRNKIVFASVGATTLLVVLAAGLSAKQYFSPQSKPVQTPAIGGDSVATPGGDVDYGYE